MGTALTTRKEILGIPVETLDKIESLQEQFSNEINPQEITNLAGALVVAEYKYNLDKLITDDLCKRIKYLENTPMGWKSDKARQGGYDIQTIKQCMVPMFLIGLQPVNNQINIIAGNPYITRNGYNQLLKKIPEFTGFKWDINVIEFSPKGAKVKYKAEWVLNGKKDNLVGELPVKTDNYTTIDAVMGKGERKVFKRVYDYLTSSCLSHLEDGDVSDREIVRPIEATVVNQENKTINFGNNKKVDTDTGELFETGNEPDPIAEIEEVTPTDTDDMPEDIDQEEPQETTSITEGGLEWLDEKLTTGKYKGMSYDELANHPEGIDYMKWCTEKNKGNPKILERFNKLLEVMDGK